MLLQSCRVRGLDHKTKRVIKQARAGAKHGGGGAAAQECAYGEGEILENELAPLEAGWDEVWMYGRRPGWLADKDNDFPSTPQDSASLAGTLH